MQGLWMKVSIDLRTILLSSNFFQHVQYYLDSAADASRIAKYAGFLHAQSSAVYHYGTDADDDVGSVWYAPNQGGSVFTPKTSASGLAAHISNAKVCAALLSRFSLTPFLSMVPVRHCNHRLVVSFFLNNATASSVNQPS